MPEVRKRASRTTATPESTGATPETDEELRVIPLSKLNKLNKLSHKQDQGSKRWSGIIFGLGGVFGLILAAVFAKEHSGITLDGLLDINLDSLIDVIPAGIINDAKDITVPSAMSDPRHSVLG